MCVVSSRSAATSQSIGTGRVGWTRCSPLRMSPYSNNFGTP